MSKYFNPRLLNAVIAGTGMRNPVRPHVILGSEDGEFVRGDLMDANAIQEFINQKISDLVNNAPEALDTLKELADAIQENGVADLVTKGQLEAALANKADKIDGKGLSTNDYTNDDKAVVDSLKPAKYNLLDYLFSDGTTGPDLVEGKTPVGICVAPASHFADGKARFMSVKVMKQGSISGSNGYSDTPTISWGPNTDTNLRDYSGIATINSDGTYLNNRSGTTYIGTNEQYSNLGITKEYNGKYYSSYIRNGEAGPCPFLNDNISKNEVYFTPNLALSDINGIENTNALVELGEEYYAANACHTFAPGLHDGEWYLPAIGELGYVIANRVAIQTKINAISVLDRYPVLDYAHDILSSTEATPFTTNNTTHSYVYKMDSFTIGTGIKTIYSNTYARAFLALPEGVPYATKAEVKQLQSDVEQLQSNIVQSDWNQSDNTAIDYIKNKPTIPDAQIQSDWNQADNTAKDYIKNKPDISALEARIAVLEAYHTT